MDIKKDRSLIIGLMFAAILVISGCQASMIEDVKSQENIGSRVTVSGTVQNSIKIGELSGYTIKDDTGTIGVSSESLPAEGSDIRISGILMKDMIFDYYIRAD